METWARLCNALKKYLRERAKRGVKPSMARVRLQPFINPRIRPLSDMENENTIWPYLSPMARWMAWHSLLRRDDNSV